jgi:excisionase family DNA binding protein
MMRVMKLEQDVYMTPQEVAAFFAVDTKTITRWAKKGEFDGKVRVRMTMGGHRRYRQADILAYAAATDRP